MSSSPTTRMDTTTVVAVMMANSMLSGTTGIPLARNEVIVYVICSSLAGLAGIIHASQLYSAEPASGQATPEPPSPPTTRRADEVARLLDELAAGRIDVARAEQAIRDLGR